MKVFRFMSKEEFEKYMNGDILINTVEHIAKTNSRGFCFLSLKDFEPEEAMHFLSGIVTFDVCAVFETDVKLNKSYGVYAKPIKETGNIMNDLINLFSNFTTFKTNEYCTTSYDKRKMKLIRYTENIWKQWNPAEKQLKLDWKEAKYE